MNGPGAQADDPRPGWWRRHRLSVLQPLSMACAAGVLFACAHALGPAPCWAVYVLAGLVAFPVWRYRTEYLLLRRRLVLDGVALPDSGIRTLLWRGTITRAVQVVVSLALAWLLLVFVSQLSEEHGYVLAVDGLLLGVLVGPVTRRLRADITQRHLGAVARRWPLRLVNGLAVTAALVALDFFLVGAPDTRHLPWHRVAEQAFALNASAGCVLWGVTAGFMAAIEALSWHASSLVIPNLPDNTAQIIAWFFVLLRAGTVAWLLTALLLGVGALLDTPHAGHSRAAPYSLVSRAFFLTIIVLALPFFYAAIKLAQIDPATFEHEIGDMARAVDPCAPDAAARRRVVAALDGSVEREREAAAREIEATVDRDLDRLFQDVEKRVDGYLDWYFTVLGEYQRLAAVFAEDVAAAMSSRLEQHLFGDSGFDERLSHLEHRLEQIPAQRFAAMRPNLAAQLEQLPCDVGPVHLAPLAELDADALRASAAAGSGAGAAIVTSKVLAKKTAAAVAAKVAAKKSFQTGTALTSKALAKKGTSSALSAWLGTSLCAPTGPVAILCGIGAGIATWLAVDTALVEVDERLNRDEMRADILKALEEQKAALAAQLKQIHYTRTDRVAAQVNETVQRAFVPYRDGLPR